MDNLEIREYLDNKFDKIHGKLDIHMDRLARLETEVINQKGTIRIMVSVAIASVGGLLSLLYKKLFN